MFRIEKMNRCRFTKRKRSQNIWLKFALTPRVCYRIAQNNHRDLEFGVRILLTRIAEFPSEFMEVCLVDKADV